MMHLIEIRSTGVSCSCGIDVSTFGGAEAACKAHQHMRIHLYDSKIVDLRLCSIICTVEAFAFGKEKPRIHHEDCFNLNDDPPEANRILTNAQSR